MVLMLNPSVGEMVLMSSLFSRLTIVVFPALSSPLSVDAIKDVRSKGAAADTVRGPGGHLARPAGRPYLSPLIYFRCRW